MKTFKTIRMGFLAAAAALVCFSSCSSDDDQQSGGNPAPQRESLVVLTINTGKMMSRAATTTPLTDSEKHIEDLTVGIFDKAGNKRVVRSFKAAELVSVPGTSKAEVKIFATDLTIEDEVVVVANTNEKKAALEQAATKDAFNQVTLESATAVKQKLNANKDNNLLPKYGETKLTQGNLPTTFKADVKVKNLVSRVTLNDLKVELAQAGAGFELTDIYLTHLPKDFAFSPTGWVDGLTNAKTDFIHGILSKEDGAAESNVDLHKAVTTAGEQSFLYTTPNKTQTGNNTRLVLKGKFTPGTGANAEVVYYALPLNVAIVDGAYDSADGEAMVFATSPGKNYKCNVTIKKKGSTDPWDATQPQVAEINVEAQNWVDVLQDTTFQ